MTTDSTFARASFNAATQTYTISPGITTAEIQSLLANAAEGTTFRFTEGKFTFTDTLKITTDGITITGAGEGKTEFHFDYDGKPGHSIYVAGEYQDHFNGALAKDAHAGDMTITLENASGLKAGDVIQIQQQNTRAWLDSNGYENVQDSYMNLSIHESLVEIKSVNGNVITLKQPVTHDMEADSMTTTVKLLDPVEDVSLSGFSVTYALGESDPDNISNQEPDFQHIIGLYLEKTLNASVEHVSVDEAPSHSMEFRTSLSPFVNYFTADGAHNKGATGDGYGIQLSETYYGTFDNLVLTDVRHAFVFSSWHTEVGNEVHITYTNRDINFHGGPDYNNTVIVDSDIYRSGDTIWRLVSPGGSHHPYTDISNNIVVFGVAQGAAKQDEFYGWNYGAWLDGGEGNDMIHGGAGDDIILSGKGYDDIWVGEGADIVAFRPGDGRDDIWDFNAAEDSILIDGFSGVNSFSDLQISGSTDATITVNGERLAVLHGVSANELSSKNFTFNDDSVFTPPQPNVPDDPFKPPVDQPEEPEEPEDPVDPVDPEPDPDPVPVEGLTIKATSKTESIQGTAENDRILAYSSQISPDDIIQMGEGFDTIEMLSGSYDFDGRTFKNFSGVDQLDLSGTKGNSIVVLDRDIIEQTDHDSFTVYFGTKGIGKLDTSALAEGTYTVDWKDDSVTVSLTESGGHEDPDDETPPGNGGEDPVDPTPDPDPVPVEGITVKASSRVETINGTGGNDRVLAYSSQIATDDTVHLGAGFDTIEMLSGSYNFDGRTFKNFSGVDQLDLSGTKGNSIVVLDRDIIEQSDNDSFTVYFGTKGIGKLDVSALAEGTYNSVWKADSVTVSLIGGGNNETPGNEMPDDGTPDETPGSENPSYDPDPVVIADRAELVFKGGAVTGIDASLYAKTDSITGTDKNDHASTWMGQLSSEDTVNLGAGFDTLEINNTGLIFNASLYSKLFGIDHLDVTNAPGNAEIILNSAFLSRTDKGTLFVSFDDGIKLLDTGGVNASLYKVALYGDGDVWLSGGNDTATLARGASAVLHGGQGSDSLRGNALDNVIYGDDGNDFLYGEGGNDVLFAGGGADKLTGGSGVDRFVISHADALDYIVDFADEDALDLTLLLEVNGLGGKTQDELVASGHLSVRGDAQGVTIGFDADGTTGSTHAMTDIVRLDGADENMHIVTKNTAII